jgi:hypothetical protein
MAILCGSALVACFDPPQPDVAFLCGDGDSCPDGYECRADGCCHRIGSSETTECPGTATPDAGPDAMLADAMPVDGAPLDADTTDAMPPVDAMPDATPPDDAMTDATPDAAPTFALVSLTPSSTIVTEGDTVDLTVTIDNPAPAGGLMIGVASDDAGVATVPTTVTVPAGNTSAPVTVTGTGGGFVTITATLGTDTADADVAVAGTTAAAGDVVVTEFAALPSSGTNDGELIELVNTSGVALDISGWSIGDGTDTDTVLAPSLAAGDPVYLMPGQAVYGVPNPADANDIPGDAGFVYGSAGAALELADAGESIIVGDGTTIIDTVDFTGWVTTPGATPGATQFAGLADRTTQLAAGSQSAAGNDSGAAWCVPATPTPGASNAGCAAAVINEVLADPTGADTDLEFVELAVVPGADLSGLRLRVLAADGTLTGADLTLAAGTRAPLDGFLVIGDNSGGSTQVAEADLETTLGLPDIDGAVQLVGAGPSLVDAVGYGTLTATTDADLGLAIVETAATTSAEGSSMARDAASTDTGDNSADFHLDPTPTPGTANDAVQLTINAITPDDGLATVATDVVITGTDFGSAAIVTVDGGVVTCTVVDATRLDCTVPDNGGTVLAADVAVQNPGSPAVTETGGFTYTGVLADPGSSFWCNTQSPVTLTSAAGASSGDVFGQIFVEGQTDTSAEPVAGILGEVGYGADGVNPQLANWTWFPAQPNAGFDFSGNNDEHVGQMTAPAAAGGYDYGYRFSLDGGLNWYYCDTNGSDDAFNQPGTWTVN